MMFGLLFVLQLEIHSDLYIWIRIESILGVIGPVEFPDEKPNLSKGSLERRCVVYPCCTNLTASSEINRETR